MIILAQSSPAAQDFSEFIDLEVSPQPRNDISETVNPSIPPEVLEALPEMPEFIEHCQQFEFENSRKKTAEIKAFNKSLEIGRIFTKWRHGYAVESGRVGKGRPNYGFKDRFDELVSMLPDELKADIPKRTNLYRFASRYKYEDKLKEVVGRTGCYSPTKINEWTDLIKKGIDPLSCLNAKVEKADRVKKPGVNSTVTARLNSEEVAYKSADSYRDELITNVYAQQQTLDELDPDGQAYALISDCLDRSRSRLESIDADYFLSRSNFEEALAVHNQLKFKEDAEDLEALEVEDLQQAQKVEAEAPSAPVEDQTPQRPLKTRHRAKFKPWKLLSLNQSKNRSLKL